MTQFLRVRTDHCQLVIDCDYVQEVAIWHEAKAPAKETLWNDSVLEGASLASVLGLTEDQVNSAVVLRDPQSGLPVMLLGVSEVVGLINLPDDDFRLVLNGQGASLCTRTATFSQELEEVLLKLEVDILIRTLQHEETIAKTAR